MSHQDDLKLVQGPGEEAAAEPVLVTIKDLVAIKAETEPGVELETGYESSHAITATKPQARSTLQVLISCVSVIALLALGWGIYWFKGGEEVPAIKLALLMGSFAVCSWGMNVVDKTLVKDLGVPTLVTGAQMFMTVVACLIIGRSKFSGSWDEIAKWCVIPFIFFSMLVSSFFTYKYLTLSMLMLVRNLGPIITLPIETAIMPADKKPYVTTPMLMALAVVLGSTFVYCQKIEVKLGGILLAILNMCLAITDRVAQRRLLTTECKGLSTETCVFLNNFVGLVPTAVMAVVTGEFAKVDAAKFFLSMTTVLLVLSGVIGTGICYFAIAVQREISATSFMVLQNCVRMAVVFVGVLVFLDPIGWPWQVIGLAMSFVGALLYGKAQLDGVSELKALEAIAKSEMAEEGGPDKSVEKSSKQDLPEKEKNASEKK